LMLKILFDIPRYIDGGFDMMIGLVRTYPNLLVNIPKWQKFALILIAKRECNFYRVVTVTKVEEIGNQMINWYMNLMQIGVIMETNHTKNINALGRLSDIRICKRYEDICDFSRITANSDMLSKHMSNEVIMWLFDAIDFSNIGIYNIIKDYDIELYRFVKQKSGKRINMANWVYNLLRRRNTNMDKCITFLKTFKHELNDIPLIDLDKVVHAASSIPNWIPIIWLIDNLEVGKANLLFEDHYTIINSITHNGTDIIIKQVIKRLTIDIKVLSILQCSSCYSIKTLSKAIKILKSMNLNVDGHIYKVMIDRYKFKKMDKKTIENHIGGIDIAGDITVRMVYHDRVVRWLWQYTIDNNISVPERYIKKLWKPHYIQVEPSGRCTRTYPNV
jgi:hypothetical protein